MKRKLTLFMFLLVMLGTFTVSLQGLTTWNVPGDKATLAAAITDLNTVGNVIDSYVINLVAGNPQTAPAGGYTITANGTVTNTITIQGNGNTITAFTPQVSGTLHDAIFEIVGGDYITIQNFVMQENAANTTTASATNNMTEWGVAVLYATATNGSQYISIKNTTISLNRTYQNTFGIYVNATHTATSVTTGATATGAFGGNHGLAITGNSISNINNGISVVGPTAAADHNDGITIGGSAGNANTITNFGTTASFSGFVNVSGTVNGVLVRNTKNYNISYNTITSSVGGTTGTTGTLRGIFIPAASNAVTGSPTNTVNNNSISLKSAVASGAMHGILTEGNSITSTTTLNINNNDFNNTTHTVAASGAIYCVYNTGAALNVNINNNTFTNLSVNTSGSFYFISNSITLPAAAVQNVNSNRIVTAFNKTVGGGTVYLFYSFTSSPAGVTQNNMNNNFSNITLTGATTMAGWQNADGGAPTKTITGNVFNNWVCGSSAVTVLNVSYFGATSNVSGNTITNISGTSAITALSVGSSGAATLLNIDNNTINNITSTGTGGSVIGISNSSPATLSAVYNNVIHTMSSTGSASIVTGITSGASTSNVSKNTVYNLSVTAAGGSCYGIAVSGGTTNNVFNNMIYGLQAPGSATAATVPSLQGIRISGGTTANVHYNSVLLNYDGASLYYSTAGLYISGGTTNEIRNNIFSNKCAPGASGRTVAVWKTSLGATNLGANSNKNIYFVGDSPDATHLVGFFNTTPYATIEEYKAALVDRDLGSYYENAPYLSESDPIDLHINGSISTRVEGNAVAMVSLCDVDFDGANRNDSTPDIGADEGVFTAVQAPPGIPVYSSPANNGTGIAINAPLTWSANSEGGTPTSYEVYFDQADGSTLYETVLASPSNPPREFGKTYYWKVIAINNEGQSEGAAWKFDTASGIPTLTFPANAATGISANPTFTWAAVAGATYKIKCGTSSGATDVLNMVACATNSYAVVTPLPYSTPLYWSVFSVNGAQEVQSAEWSFTTMANPNNYSYPYAMDFEEITVAGSLPLNWSKTGSKWTSMTTTPTTSVYNRAPRGGTDYLTCAYSSTATDWLFSRGMYLDASKTYDLGMWYNTDGLAGWTSLKMYIGTLATGAGMTTELASVLAPVNMTYTQLSKTAWQPPTSGIYYVGFQVIATSGPWYLSFDDFSVAETPVNPVFAINPTSKAFSDTQINTSSASQNFTISNAGGGTLTISEISLTGANVDQFTLTNGNTIPQVLGAGQSIVVSVVFNPTSLGAKTASLQVVDNLAKTTNNAALTGTGVDKTIYNLPYLQTLSEVPQAQYWQQFSTGTGITDRWSVAATTNAGGLTPEWHCLYQAINPGMTRLVSPPISVTGLSQLIVKYRQAIDDYGVGCNYKLRYGYTINTFVDLWNQASASNVLLPAEEKVFTLTSELVGHDVIYICWEVEGNLNQFDHWYIDNIKFLPTNTEVNQVVATGATANVTIPPITVAGAQVSPQVGFAGLSGNPIINVSATYQPAGSSTHVGMVLNVTGGNFSGVTMNITHNLGFIPQWIKYQVGTGIPITVMNDLTWTTTTATITISGGKGPNDVLISFPKDGQTLAVTLSSFSAVLTADMFVKIAWVAESETSHSGYNVLRATENDVNAAAYINAGLISGGTPLGTQISYTYTDSEAASNTVYYYWLESVSLEGTSEFFGPLTVTIGDGPDDPTPPIPMLTELLNAYPNPFNPSTSLRYTLKEAGAVQIDIFNLKGQLIRRMNANHAAPGYFNMIWDGRDASGMTVGSGVYMYQMSSGKYTAARKMILSK